MCAFRMHIDQIDLTRSRANGVATKLRHDVLLHLCWSESKCWQDLPARPLKEALLARRRRCEKDARLVARMSASISPSSKKSRLVHASPACQPLAVCLECPSTHAGKRASQLLLQCRSRRRRPCRRDSSPCRSSGASERWEDIQEEIGFLAKSYRSAKTYAST
jgi:hypothetical protein